MKIENKTIKKGTPEWRALCGAKNKNNAHAVKHGGNVKKPLICSKDCKLFENGCPYAESCEGKECIVLIKEKEIIEDIIQKKKEFLTKRININSVRLEIQDRICMKRGNIDYSELYPTENHLIELMEKFEKNGKKG